MEDPCEYEKLKLDVKSLKTTYSHPSSLFQRIYFSSLCFNGVKFGASLQNFLPQLAMLTTQNSFNLINDNMCELHHNEFYYTKQFNCKIVRSKIRPTTLQGSLTYLVIRSLLLLVRVILLYTVVMRILLLIRGRSHIT